MLLNKHWLKEILFVVLFSLLPLFWLQTDQVILGHDSGGRLFFTEYYTQLLQTWNNQLNFGTSTPLSAGFLLVQLPELVFSLLMPTASWAQRLSYTWWFAVMGVGMYTCAYFLFPQREKRWFRIITTLFYQYNFFILQAWFIAERAKFSLYAALPLGFIILYKMLRHEWSVFWGSIAFSLVFFFFNGGGLPPFFGNILLAYGVLFLVSIVHRVLRKELSELVHIVKIVFACLLLTVLLNAYWILPVIITAFTSYSSTVSSSGGIDALFAWERMVSQFATFSNLLRLQGIPDWYHNPSHAYANMFISDPMFIALSFVPIMLIGYALRYWPEQLRNKTIRYDLLITIFLIFIIGCALTAGSTSPLGFIFKWLFYNVPGFAIFRSAFYKFGQAYWFAFALLFGLSFQVFYDTIPSRWKLHRYIAPFCILLVLVYHWPFFAGQFFRFNPPFTTRVTVPEYVFTMRTHIENAAQPRERILLLPQLSRVFTADAYTWGYWSLDILPEQVLTSTVVTNNQNIPQIDSIYRAIELEDAEQLKILMVSTGITSILWRGDVLYPDELTKSENFIAQKEFISTLSETPHTEGEWSWYRLTPQNVATTSSSIPIIVQANCVVCITPIEQQAVDGSLNEVEVVRPYISVMPYSPIYPYILIKESIGTWLSSLQGEEAEFSRHMLLANKRLLEYSFTSTADVTLTKEQESELLNNFIAHWEAAQALKKTFSDTVPWHEEYVSYLAIFDQLLRDTVSGESVIQVQELQMEILHAIEEVHNEVLTEREQDQEDAATVVAEQVYTLMAPFEGEYHLQHMDGVGSVFQPVFRQSDTKVAQKLSEQAYYLSRGEHTITIKSSEIPPERLGFEFVYQEPIPNGSSKFVIAEPISMTVWSVPNTSGVPYVLLPQRFDPNWKLISAHDTAFTRWKEVLFGSGIGSHRAVGQFSQSWKLPAESAPDSLLIIYAYQYWFILGGVVTMGTLSLIGIMSAARLKQRRSA